MFDAVCSTFVFFSGGETCWQTVEQQELVKNGPARQERVKTPWEVERQEQVKTREQTATQLRINPTLCYHLATLGKAFMS